MTELEELKQQAQTILNRISELEKKQEVSETFDDILSKLDKSDREELETVKDHQKILEHSALYKDLKRIEGYVNRKFGGKIDWSNEQQIKFCPWYQSSNGAFGYNEATTAIDSPFALISMEAYKYFIKVTGDKLIEFFKTSH